MDKSGLVRLFGFPATLLHGDTLVLDRWRWLRTRVSANRGLHLLDVGCGSGAFTIGAALLGYSSLGLSWDESNQRVATQRASLCGAPQARFEGFDVRRLHERLERSQRFAVEVCLENIEHVIDERKLMRDIARLMNGGGRLLLTTPNIDYRSITPDDEGPFLMIEDGRHVRRGYSESMLRQLCADAGLTVDDITFCSGLISQKLTWLLRTLSRVHPLIGWLCILPLRIF